MVSAVRGLSLSQSFSFHRKWKPPPEKCDIPGTGTRAASSPRQRPPSASSSLSLSLYPPGACRHNPCLQKALEYEWAAPWSGSHFNNEILHFVQGDNFGAWLGMTDDWILYLTGSPIKNVGDKRRG